MTVSITDAVIMWLAASDGGTPTSIIVAECAPGPMARAAKSLGVPCKADGACYLEFRESSTPTQLAWLSKIRATCLGDGISESAVEAALEAVPEWTAAREFNLACVRPMESARELAIRQMSVHETAACGMPWLVCV